MKKPCPGPDWQATEDSSGSIWSGRSRKLPDGARAAFVLYDVEGFQHHEIASILGISEGTSKSQVHKARLRLRALLTASL